MTRKIEGRFRRALIIGADAARRGRAGPRAHRGVGVGRDHGARPSTTSGATRTLTYEPRGLFRRRDS